MNAVFESGNLIATAVSQCWKHHLSNKWLQTAAEIFLVRLIVDQF